MNIFVFHVERDSKRSQRDVLSTKNDLSCAAFASEKSHDLIQYLKTTKYFFPCGILES